VWPQGIGDDAAILLPDPGEDLVVSTDMLLDGACFLLDQAGAKRVGRKSLAVNLSDLAAMGAPPLACVLGLGLPSVDENWLSGFAQGFHEFADRSGCPLIGGDTTRSQRDIVISVTVYGAVLPQHALRRDAAVVGDDIWVSGTLGRADVAYRLLAREWPAVPGLLDATRQALERPQPRLGLGAALGGIARAALDISDGIVQDLGHILTASGVGAVLDYAALPVDPALLALPAERIASAVLGGGDVYELCFTAGPNQRDAVLQAARAAGTPVTRVGRVIAGGGLQVLDVNGQPMQLLRGGFDHFSEG
ncbi:MAG: thiamine-phosphate kinase, partial [Burkholderiaceae bacterium]|nr:thiamine-phosphate kinase [Burkholderiaceae bacterium]